MMILIGIAWMLMAIHSFISGQDATSTNVLLGFGITFIYMGYAEKGA